MKSTILSLLLASAAAHAADPVQEGNLKLAAPDAAVFHMAPDGSDANPGTAERPFATLERARDALRGKGGGEIVVHGGTYVLERTFELTPPDSGSRTTPVRYIAAPGETPVFSSLREITGWIRHNQDIWVADIPKGWRFHHLYVDGQEQKVACFPKGGVASLSSWPSVLDTPRPQLTPEGLKVHLPPGLLAGLPENGDVEVNFLTAMFWNTLAVLRKVEGDSAVLASRNPSTWEYGGRYRVSAGNVRIQNALVHLTQPGEWCVDSAAGKVFYWPPDGEMNSRKVTAPTLCELFRLQGDDMAAQNNNWRVKYDTAGHRVEGTTPAPDFSSPSAFGQLVRYVEFIGLTFEGTDRMPEDQWPDDWLKRNCENPDGAFYVQGAEACTISGCTFRKCAAYAVVLDHYARRMSILGNDMHELGSGGIQASGYGPGTLDVNGHHVIRRNYIHDIGRSYMHAAAVSLYGSNHNDISLNWISQCPYAGVQIAGATQAILTPQFFSDRGASMDLFGNRNAQFQVRWHEMPAPHPACSGDYEEIKQYQHSGGNWIRRNVISNYMNTLADGGGLYCWSPDHDNVWLENILMHGRGYIIYMDDDTGRSVVAGNRAWTNGQFFENSHNPTASAYRAPGDTYVHANNKLGMTVIAWINNLRGFPDKPDGFDELLATITDLASAQGGWPSTLKEPEYKPK